MKTIHVDQLITYDPKSVSPQRMDEKASKFPKNAFCKDEEANVWQDVLGKEKSWNDSTTQEKMKAALVNVLKLALVLGCLYLFVCSLDLLSSSFRLISGKSTGAVMNNSYVSNPIVGLMIGILVTVLVQSSSTSTSIIVSMVASGILQVHDAIPMIMGSNIGTSVTNTIVSLTQVGDRDQFRRAFAGATVHDMFNWITVIVLLSIEVPTGMLEKLTNLTVNSFASGEGAKVELLDVITEPLVDLVVQLDSQVVRCWGMGFMHDESSMIKRYCEYIQPNATASRFIPTVASKNASLVPEVCRVSGKIGRNHSCNFLFYERDMTDGTIGIILLIVSLTVLCTSLICIVKLLNSMLKGSIANLIQRFINSDIPYVPWLTGYVAIFVGALLTFIVQSSSVFTSTLTPLIGIGLITVERAYPLTLGSNLGTTTTALLAAMAADGDKRDSIQIALVHSFFNILGILIFFPIPFMRWPIPLAKKLGRVTSSYRWFAIFYLVLMFFLLPGAVFALSMGGAIVLWSFLGPAIVIAAFVIVINVLQEKWPSVLPDFLKTWDFLPEPLRSLAPYDKVLTALPCCKKCRDSSQTAPEEVHQIITVSSAYANMNNGSVVVNTSSKFGIENPVEVTD